MSASRLPVAASAKPALCSAMAAVHSCWVNGTGSPYGQVHGHRDAGRPHRTLQEIRDAGLWKQERQLTSPQSAHVTTQHADALNFCANNYLGLADDPRVVAAATAALQEWGFGMASVRFICGTQTLHTELEGRLASFLGTEAALLYSSCFDANGGIFETLFGPDDAIISDELNHASLIDGIRLSRARRLRYRNADMGDLAV